MSSAAPAPASSYRGRIAPSPTGYLHVGHARTFRTAWQRARDAGGALILRMEDLDPDRSKPVYAEAAIEDLRWLGIRWQEGPDTGGPFAPYEQSKRHSAYLAAWRTLLQSGHLFPCRCSRKDLEAALAAPHERAHTTPDALDDEPVYPGTCRPGTCRCLQREAPQHSGPDGNNWRFRVPDGETIEFVDGNLGPQRFVAGVDFGDFIVWRRDSNPGSPRTGLRPWGDNPGSPQTGPKGVPARRAREAGPWGGGVPSYQLACVADDAAMGITEVVRGADLLKSTARQILLNRALGFRDPAWYHCPLVVDRNGLRLAKRHDALSLRALRRRGLTPTEILSSNLLREAGGSHDPR